MRKIAFILFLFVVVNLKASDITFYDFQGQLLESAQNAAFMMLVDRDTSDSTLYHASVRWIRGQVNRNMSYRLKNIEMVYEGLYEEFDKSGNHIEITNYKNGKLHGDRIIYSTNNKRIGVIKYKNGAFDYKCSLDLKSKNIVALDSLDSQASFPGGEIEYEIFMRRNLGYPLSMEEGLAVVQFVINKDGHISNIECLNKPDEYIVRAAVEFVKLMPKWIPALKNGEEVNSIKVLPIFFKLDF
ncbi:MAG: energy transducer TonB [Bacteroidales bacterium]